MVSGGELSSDALHLLWNVGGAADRHVDYAELSYLVLPFLEPEEVQVIAWDLLQVFQRLGAEHPQVVLPFLGTLLNEAQAGGRGVADG